MNHPEATVAIFRFLRPNGHTGVGAADSWLQFLNDTFGASGNKALGNISDMPTSLPEFVSTLRLPDEWPTLCHFLEAVKKHGISYSVQLFGPALLTFDSTKKENTNDV